MHAGGQAHEERRRGREAGGKLVLAVHALSRLWLVAPCLLQLAKLAAHAATEAVHTATGMSMCENADPWGT